MNGKRNWLPVKSGYFHRARIDALFHEGLNSTLITVVAGPGYGKTASAAAFAQNTDRRVVWLHLSKYNNTVTRFWEIFIQAVQLELPHLAADLERIGFPNTASGFEAFLRVFAKDVYSGEQVVVFVDDFDCIIESDILAFFESLVEVGLENICLVAVSSRKTCLHVAGLKSGGGLYSITSEDLKFTEREIDDFLRHHGIHCTANDVAELYAKTEGWPLSLNLLAVQCKNKPFDLVAVKTRLSLASDLFEREFFLGYTRDLQLLLIKLSLLPGFSMEIIRDISDHSNVEAYTEFVLKHLFIKYDMPAGMFVLHNMYREYLLQMTFMLDRGETDQIFRVAGGWYLENNLLLNAMHCFLKCGDYDRILQAVRKLPKQRLQKDFAQQVLHILDELPKEYAEAQYLVAFSTGMMLLNNMEVEKARLLYLRLVQNLEKGGINEEVRHDLGEVYSILADISILQNTDEFLRYFKKASEHLDYKSWIRDPETLYIGNNGALFLSCSSNGELVRMIDMVTESMQYAEKMYNGSGYGFELLFMAEAAFYTHNIDKARALCFKAIYKAQDEAQHDIVCNAYFLLLRISVYLADYRQAMTYLDTLCTYGKQHSSALIIEMCDCAKGWFYPIVKDFNQIPQWIIEHDTVYFAKLPIGMGRNRVMYPMYLMALNKYHEASAALQQTESVFRQKGLWSVRLTVLTMLAICEMKTGNAEHAVDYFWQAYDLSWRNGIVFPFIEYGNLMRTLISTAQKSQQYTFDAGWLDSLYIKSTAYAKRHSAFVMEYDRDHNRLQAAASPGTKLTGREREILGCLAKGMTREEISSFAGISLNGVKKHITGIYNKLGAVNRADAVRLATIYGILE